MSVNCRFCELPIEKSRLTSHYRKKHKAMDLARAIVVIPRRNQQVIVILPESNSEEEKSQTDSQEERTCMMCLNEHSTITQPCNHDSSCRSCLMRWWKESYRSPRCPICRGEISHLHHEGEIDDVTVPSWFSWRRRLLNRGNRRVTRRLPGFIQ